MIDFKLIESYNAKKQKLNKITRITSIIRLALGITTVIFLVCLLALQSFVLYGCLTAGSLAIMLLVILLTNKFYIEEAKISKILLAYEIHNARRKTSFNLMADDGKEFFDKNDYKSYDLDLFGNKSIYQYLSSAKTPLGRIKFANSLKNSETYKDEKFTKMIESLGNDESSIEIEAALMEFKSQSSNFSYDEYLSVIDKKCALKPYKIALSVASLLIMIAIITLCIITKMYYLIWIPFVVNFIVSFVLTDDVFLVKAGNYFSISKAYLSLAKSLEKINIEDECYKEIKSNISSAIPGIKTIKKAYLTLSLRGNVLVRVILNILFLFDFFISLAYNSLITKYLKNSVNKTIFENIAKLEVALSFANIVKDMPYYTIASDSENTIAEGLYHPLVKNCIDNDFTLDGGVVLTGSNMSGKTTFMRTIGINQILYNAGSVICAKSYSSSIFDVNTSLRANDMLQEGVSTFKAEILRMKTINSNIKDHRCLILVDEIFKGTNAYERIEASLKVIDKLNENKALFIISTHDLELCDAKNIKNYHFNETYTDDLISFDYKIKDGKSDTTNAMYLLKMADII